jgi:hypothetical protein
MTDREATSSSTLAPPLETPVAFVVFNRPETTERVFRAIAAARPRTLLVVADGPRADRPGEGELCQRTRAIATAVNWPCDVRTNFAPANLGCGRRVSSGLDWVFSEVDRAVVLEDDCLPAPDFFPFCSAMLDRYADDPRVMHVSGANFQFGRRRGPYSYYFSRHVLIWGWATWRRAWRHYDFELKSWPRFRAERLGEVCRDAAEEAYWTASLDKVARGQLDTWDYQWLFACWQQRGLAVIPNTNLVSNIGFGPTATHTSGAGVGANLPAGQIGALRHPPDVKPDAAADAFYVDYFLGAHGLRGLRGKLRRRLWRWGLRFAG